IRRQADQARALRGSFCRPSDPPRNPRSGEQHTGRNRPGDTRCDPAHLTLDLAHCTLFHHSAIRMTRLALLTPLVTPWTTQTGTTAGRSWSTGVTASSASSRGLAERRV